jgi:uncharacterized ion transporter superfamily protein YfcC
MSAVIAAAPALPLHSAVKYVAAAYVVFLAILLIYVAIMAKRLHDTERDLVDLRRDLEARQLVEHEPDEERHAV